MAGLIADEAAERRQRGPLVWRSFPRQEEAFAFASTCSQAVRVFAYEPLGSQGGRRRYLVASTNRFFDLYLRLPREDRCHYEVIPEGTPCRLYFDLEYDRRANPDRDGAAMTRAITELACAMLYERYGLRCDWRHVISLDSTTEKKFSRHIIVAAPGAVFRSFEDVGAFVRSMVAEMDAVKEAAEQEAAEVAAAEAAEAAEADDVHAAKEVDVGAANAVFKAMGALTDGGAALSAERTAVTSGGWTAASVELIAATGASERKGEAPRRHDTASATDARRERTAEEDAVGHQDCRGGVAELPSTASELPMVGRSGEECCNDDYQTSKAGGPHLAFRGSSSEGRGPSHAPHATSSGRESASTAVLPDVSRLCHEAACALDVRDSAGQCATFIDMGVYTRNRNFRLYLSSKRGRHAWLTLSDDCQFPVEGKLPETRARFVYEQSLVTQPSFVSDPSQLLRCHEPKGSLTNAKPGRRRCTTASYHDSDTQMQSTCLQPRSGEGLWGESSG